MLPAARFARETSITSDGRLGCVTVAVHRRRPWSPVQDEESTPERLDGMPEAAAPAEAGAEPPTAADQLPVSGAPEAVPAGDLRQQLEARRRARAGH